MTDRTSEGPLSLWPLLSRTDGAFRLAHRWQIPSDIRLDGDVLRYGKPSPRARMVSNPPIQLLTDFVKLVEAEPHEIAEYAKRWGVLGLCQHHDLVAGHQHAPDFGSEPCRLLCAEPIERWRYYAGALKWLLEEGAMLRECKDRRLRTARIERFLDACYRVVLYFGCLRPMLVLEDGRFDIKLAAAGYWPGLAGALTTQFLFVVAGAAGMANCKSCGRLFFPRRRPRTGEDSYCSDCGVRAAWRAAQQRKRRGKGVYAPRDPQQKEK